MKRKPKKKHKNQIQKKMVLTTMLLLVPASIKGAKLKKGIMKAPEKKISYSDA